MVEVNFCVSIILVNQFDSRLVLYTCAKVCVNFRSFNLQYEINHATRKNSSPWISQWNRVILHLEYFVENAAKNFGQWQFTIQLSFDELLIYPDSSIIRIAFIEFH